MHVIQLVCVNHALLSSFSLWQLHLQTELYTAGPVGHWLCDQWWQHTADHPPQQTAVPGPHRWLQGRLVRNLSHWHTFSPSLAYSLFVYWSVVLSSPRCTCFIYEKRSTVSQSVISDTSDTSCLKHLCFWSSRETPATVGEVKSIIVVKPSLVNVELICKIDFKWNRVSAQLCNNCRWLYFAFYSMQRVILLTHVFLRCN